VTNSRELEVGSGGAKSAEERKLERRGTPEFGVFLTVNDDRFVSGQIEVGG